MYCALPNLHAFFKFCTVCIMTRPLDVALVGATGFTGRLVARYFADTIAKRLPNLRWAIVGRDQKKLTALADSLSIGPSDIIVTSNAEGIDRAASSSRVALSTAGPFALYGTPLVEACVRNGTSYVDINGEIGWHREMIDRFDKAARAADATLVPSCGFDSIPSDLGAQWMAERLGGNARRIRCYAALRGGFSGGTVASGINSELQHGSLLSDPFLLGGVRAEVHGQRTRIHPQLPRTTSSLAPTSHRLAWPSSTHGSSAARWAS